MNVNTVKFQKFLINFIIPKSNLISNPHFETKFHPIFHIHTFLRKLLSLSLSDRDSISVLCQRFRFV